MILSNKAKIFPFLWLFQMVSFHSLNRFLLWIEGHVFLKTKSRELPVASEIKNPEYVELREQLTKSKKRSKTMIKMMRAQTEMLQNILSKVDPFSEMSEVVENDWPMEVRNDDVFEVPDEEDGSAVREKWKRKTFDETAL